MNEHIDVMIEALERAKNELLRIKKEDGTDREKALEVSMIPANLLQQLRIDLIVRISV